MIARASSTSKARVMICDSATRDERQTSLILSLGAK
jgi:hypothetical protein